MKADRYSKDLSSWGGLDLSKLEQFAKFVTFGTEMNP